jgi:hypothetical protein
LVSEFAATLSAISGGDVAASNFNRPLTYPDRRNDVPGRRLRSEQLTGEEALEQAKAIARAARDS